MPTNTKINANFSAAGNSVANAIYGNFNVSVRFANATQTGTIHLMRSFDATNTTTGTFEVTDKLTSNTSAVALEPERGVYYKVRCVAVSAGSITARLGGHGER